MDFPLPRRKTTWRDSILWQATWQSLVSGFAMMVVALPLTALLSAQALRLAHLPFDKLEMGKEMIRGGLLMLPYLWFYFFALERMSRQKHQDFLP
ncbi:MAG TPA: hypothetical protein VL495_03345 [Edaphobacter sp.]|nr:hypothetical protein [Edaphobacter sp.]